MTGDEPVALCFVIPAQLEFRHSGCQTALALLAWDKVRRHPAGKVGRSHCGRKNIIGSIDVLAYFGQDYRERARDNVVSSEPDGEWNKEQSGRGNQPAWTSDELKIQTSPCPRNHKYRGDPHGEDHKIRPHQRRQRQYANTAEQISRPEAYENCSDGHHGSGAGLSEPCNQIRLCARP